MARTKKANKTVVGLLVGVAFLVVTVGGIAAISTLRKSDPTHWAQRAQEAAELGDWERAKLYFYRAYQVSDDPAYLVDVGQAMYDSGDEMAAAQFWQQAIAQNTSLIEAHESFIDLLLEFAELYGHPRAWIRLKESGEALLKVDDQNPKGHFAAGKAMLELYRLTGEKDGGSVRKGIDSLNRATQLAPEVVDYSISLAVYKLDPKFTQSDRRTSFEEQADDVERLLKRLIEQNMTPGNDAARVRFTYARLLGALNRHDEAIAMYKTTREFAGDDGEVLARVKAQEAEYWIGRWYRAKDDPEAADQVATYFDNARNLLEESIAHEPEGFTQYMLLAELYAFNGDRLKAVETCERRTSLEIHRKGLKTAARKYSRYMLLVKAADECLAQAATVDRDSQEFDALLERATGFVTDARAEYPDRGAGLHTAGKILLAQGKELEATKLFQSARKAYNRSNWQNSKMLAQLLLRNGQPGAAREAIQDALEDKQADPSCYGVAAHIALEMEDFGKAIRYADRVLAIRPTSRDALVIKEAATRKRGETEMADVIAAQITRDNPRDLLVQMRIRQAEKHYPEAIQFGERLLQSEPANVQALQSIASLFTATNQPERLAPFIDRALAADPDNHEIKILRIRTNKSLNDEERRQQQFDVLTKIKDSFTRAYELAMWYGAGNEPQKYIEQINQAERILMSPDSTLNKATKRRFQRAIVERQFLYAIDAKDSAAVNAIVEKTGRENIDGVNGFSYRGRAQMAEKRPELALASFEEALRIQPANARTLTYVGQCYMAIDPPQIFEAQTYFTRAIDTNPKLGIAHKGLAIVARMRGDNAAFEKHLTRAGRLMPTDEWIKNQLLVLREQNTPEDGIKRRETLRANSPEDIENLVALAKLYHSTRENDQATQRFEDALKLAPADTRVVVEATNFFRDLGNHERAMAVFETLIQKSETKEVKANGALLAANYWHQIGEKVKTEAAVRRAAGFAETLEVCAANARAQAELGQNDAALQWWDRTIEKADTEKPQLAAFFRRSRIDTLFRMQSYDEAESAVQDFAQRYPDNNGGLLLLSAVKTVKGDIDAAIELIDRYLETDRDNATALYQRARLYFTLGRYALAISDLERLRSKDPSFKNYQPRMLLANGYVLTHRADLAFEELESIIRNDPTAKRTAIHLVLMYGERERYTDAIRICTSMSNRYPNDPVWVKNRGDIRVKAGESAAALADYQQAARISGFNPRYAAAYMKACVNSRKFDEGIAFYTQTVPAELRAPIVTLRYAELLAGAGRMSEAVPQFLNAFHKSGFSDLGFVQRLMDAVFSIKNDDSLIEPFRAEPENPTLRRTSHHVLALLLNQFEKNSEALSELERLLATAADPDEKILLLVTIGALHEREQRWNDAKQAYEQLLQIDNQHLHGLNNLAFLLSDKLNQPQEAVAYARKAAKIFPVQSVQDTLAWTYVQMGEYRLAIAILTQALEEDPRYVPAIYHLAEAYRRDGQLQKAQNLLEGAATLITEGIGESYRPQVRKARDDVRRGETAP